MSERAFLSTRKGLFELQRGAAQWELGARHLLGEPVSVALHDGRDGALYAALNLGHFGVKLHRKNAGADQWTEIAAPAYPPKPEGSADTVEWNWWPFPAAACGAPKMAAPAGPFPPPACGPITCRPN